MSFSTSTAASIVYGGEAAHSPVLRCKKAVDPVPDPASDIDSKRSLHTLQRICSTNQSWLRSAEGDQQYVQLAERVVKVLPKARHGESGSNWRAGVKGHWVADIGMLTAAGLDEIFDMPGLLIWAFVMVMGASKKEQECGSL